MVKYVKCGRPFEYKTAPFYFVTLYCASNHLNCFVVPNFVHLIHICLLYGKKNPGAVWNIYFYVSKIGLRNEQFQFYMISLQRLNINVGLSLNVIILTLILKFSPTQDNKRTVYFVPNPADFIESFWCVITVKT